MKISDNIAEGMLNSLLLLLLLLLLLVVVVVEAEVLLIVDVELSTLRPVYSDTTQLNLTSS